MRPKEAAFTATRVPSLPVEEDLRPKWECTVAEIQGDLKAGLNQMGEQGWEAIDVMTVIPAEQSPKGVPLAYVAFKRRKLLVTLAH